MIQQRNVLELLHAVHSLRFFLRVYEATERALKLLAAAPIIESGKSRSDRLAKNDRDLPRAMRHPTQTRAVPVNLPSLLIERALLLRFLLEGFRRPRFR